MKSKGNIDACPVTKETWETRAELKRADCGGGTLYHCLADYNDNKWEKCLEKTLIGKGNCPVFTSDGFLDWKPCNISEASCPKSSYVSNEVYKYPFCFGDNTPRNRTSKDNPVHSFDDPSLGSFIGILVPVVLVAAFICLVIGIWRKWRLRNFGTRSGMEIVRKGAEKLRKKGVKCIVVIGGIGNMVNSTARDILELYAILEEWKSEQYQFPEVPTTIENNTIVFVYGWFGLWNDDLCSVNDANTVCKKLLQILETTKNVKIIIGMREDLYTKYMNELDEYSSLFKNEIIIDFENTSDEYLQEFDELKECCEVCGCRCKELTPAMLKGGVDKLLEMPLKVEVISKHHYSDVIDSYIKDTDILKAIKVHFTTLKKNENPIYEWLMYICLKGYFSRNESFDKDLVSKMKFGIKFSSFDEHYVHLRRYIRVSVPDPQNVSLEDTRYVFWHPFIYICAFHHLYKKDKSTIMNHCNVDAILQLVRPTSWENKTPSSYIEVSADDEAVELFRKRYLELELDLLNKYEEHPLVKGAPQSSSKDIEQ
uniref:Uncharacterized protein LOC111133907 isoform X2 n=1 Tax=Crassostrea virginica TaxID=6565 RepID=A0A8B8ECH1_CRAVI|nr:uncharacterized protein LOC111133907 isoform X2 [Crassostrea virginica]